jgi:hypothetical protein
MPIWVVVASAPYAPALLERFGQQVPPSGAKLSDRWATKVLVGQADMRLRRPE